MLLKSPPRHLTLFVAAAALGLCAPAFAAQSQLPPPKTLYVNGVAIPASEMQAALRLAEARGAKDSAALRTSIRAQLITREVLRQAALKMHLQNDPVVVAARRQAAKEAQTQAMIRRYLALTLKPKAVTEADVRARYDAIVAGLGKQEYKFSLIAVGTKAEANDLLGRLKQNRVGFAALARMYSQLPSRVNGGAMAWVSFPVPVLAGKTQRLPLALAKEIAALKPGVVSGAPLQIGKAYFLVKLDEVRATQVPTYAKAKPMLKRVLIAQATNQAGAQLMSKLLRSVQIK